MFRLFIFSKITRGWTQLNLVDLFLWVFWGKAILMKRALVPIPILNEENEEEI